MVGLLSNRIGRDELKTGDHIYSWRNSFLYDHHGIHAGNGNVIHFTRGNPPEKSSELFIIGSSPCPTCGFQRWKNSGVVTSTCLDCFLFGGELYLYQYGVSLAVFLAEGRGGTCTFALSDPPEDVLRRALHLLAHKTAFGKWDLFGNNCEDFALYCKTGLLSFTTLAGVGVSGQAIAFVAAGLAIVASAVLAAALGSAARACAIGYGMFSVARIVSDIGVRCDAMEVPIEWL